jgi:hypothetical protein
MSSKKFVVYTCHPCSVLLCFFTSQCRRRRGELSSDGNVVLVKKSIRFERSLKIDGAFFGKRRLNCFPHEFHSIWDISFQQVQCMAVSQTTVSRKSAKPQSWSLKSVNRAWATHPNPRGLCS